MAVRERHQEVVVAGGQISVSIAISSMYLPLVTETKVYLNGVLQEDADLVIASDGSTITYTPDAGIMTDGDLVRFEWIGTI